MKKPFRLAFSVFALFAAPVLFAQSAVFLHVKIPFDFVVSGQKMPAGDYTVEESGNSGAITLKCVDMQKSAIVLGEPDTAGPEVNPGLKFEKHNGEEYLVRIVSGNGPARILPAR